jgi:hypothetical protein
MLEMEGGLGGAGYGKKVLRTPTATPDLSFQCMFHTHQSLHMSVDRSSLPVDRSNWSPLCHL